MLSCRPLWCEKIQLITLNSEFCARKDILSASLLFRADMVMCTYVYTAQYTAKSTLLFFLIGACLYHVQKHAAVWMILPPPRPLTSRCEFIYTYIYTMNPGVKKLLCTNYSLRLVLLTWPVILIDTISPLSIQAFFKLDWLTGYLYGCVQFTRCKTTYISWS